MVFLWINFLLYTTGLLLCNRILLILRKKKKWRGRENVVVYHVLGLSFLIEKAELIESFEP